MVQNLSGPKLEKDIESKSVELTQQVRVYGDKNSLTIGKEYSRKRRSLHWMSVFYVSNQVNKSSTGRFSHGLSESSSLQLLAPMVGKIREAMCKMKSRYRSAIKTGFGNVLIRKLSSV